MVQFGYTIFYVQDVERSLLFYESAFGFTRRFIVPDASYGELETGGTTLSFASLALAGANLPDGFITSSASAKPFGIEIGFVTDNVEETLKAALGGGRQPYRRT